MSSQIKDPEALVGLWRVESFQVLAMGERVLVAETTSVFPTSWRQEGDPGFTVRWISCPEDESC